MPPQVRYAPQGVQACSAGCGAAMRWYGLSQACPKFIGTGSHPSACPSGPNTCGMTTTRERAATRFGTVQHRVVPVCLFPSFLFRCMAVGWSAATSCHVIMTWQGCAAHCASPGSRASRPSPPPSRRCAARCPRRAVEPCTGRLQPERASRGAGVRRVGAPQACAAGRACARRQASGGSIMEHRPAHLRHHDAGNIRKR